MAPPNGFLMSALWKGVWGRCSSTFGWSSAYRFKRSGSVRGERIAIGGGNEGFWGVSGSCVVGERVAVFAEASRSLINASILEAAFGRGFCGRGGGFERLLVCPCLLALWRTALVLNVRWCRVRRSGDRWEDMQRIWSANLRC